MHEGGFGLSADAQGQFQFRRPDGELLPAAPVGKMRGDFAMLVRMHQRLGLAIDAHTSITEWRGEAIDWGMAIDGLIYSTDRARGSSFLGKL